MEGWKVGSLAPVRSVMDRHRLLPAARYLMVTPAKRETEAADLVIGTQLARVGTGLVLKEFGKGRVAYLASELECLYWQMRCPEIRDLFAGLVKWAAGGRLPYEVETPEGVLANLNVQPGTWILHLLNNCAANHEVPKANREYICPLHGIRVRLNIPADCNAPSFFPFILHGQDVSEFDRNCKQKNELCSVPTVFRQNMGQFCEHNFALARISLPSVFVEGPGKRHPARLRPTFLNYSVNCVVN